MESRYVYKQKSFKSYTPDNIDLAEKLNLIYAHYRNGSIEQQLEEAKDLVERFFCNKYNQVDISKPQLVNLKRLINTIKTATPAEYPLAQVVHAMFTARKGSYCINAAHAAYEKIHQDYPRYGLAYEKHIKLAHSNGQFGLVKTLYQRMMLAVSTPVEKPIRRGPPPILTKPATAHFNPVVGAGRFNLFSQSHTQKEDSPTQRRVLSQ